MSEGTVSFATRGHIFVARLSGEIDMSNAEQLGVEVAEATPENVRGVVLDLTQVEHLDSYGIFVIHGLRQRLGERQQRLVLIVPTHGRIRRAIELVGITDVIPTKETLEEAVSEFGQSVS